MSGGNIQPEDAILDEILDQVIDFVPEDLKLLSGASEHGGAASAVLTSTGAGNSGPGGGGATLLVGNQNQILGHSQSQGQNLYSGKQFIIQLVHLI